MQSKTFAHYRLLGLNLDPEEVTRVAGVEPSEVWRIGDLVVPRGQLRHKFNGWLLRSQLSSSAELHEHVEYLLQKLAPGKEQVARFGQEHQARVTCILQIQGDERPLIYFEPKVLGEVAEIRAGIVVDYYFFGEDS